MKQSNKVLQIPDSTRTVDTSGRSTEQISGEIARKWLLKFVALTGKTASPVLFDLWDEALRDVSPKTLGLACSRLLKSWRYPNLPLPGDVRAQEECVKEKFARMLERVIEKEEERRLPRAWTNPTPRRLQLSASDEEES